MLRISFDLDETIVCSGVVQAERPPSAWRRWMYPEAMRSGTKALMGALAERGCEIWVYTTSYRSPRYVRGWFRSVGVTIAGVVNQARHDRVVGRCGPSKYPPAFGIDLHVDDSEGVGTEGERHGFAVVVISPLDTEWARRVLEAVDTRLA